MMYRIMMIVCGVMLSGSALAAGMADCEQFRGMGVGEKSSFPPYRVELKMYDCAGMTQDIADLDALDRDMLFGLARHLSLKELREKKTLNDHPKKYSELTTASRLARLKRLVDAYYMR